MSGLVERRGWLVTSTQPGQFDGQSVGETDEQSPPYDDDLADGQRSVEVDAVRLQDDFFADTFEDNHNAQSWCFLGHA